MTAEPSDPAPARARALPHVFDPEFDDRYEQLLLGREPVQIDQPDLAGFVAGRTALVTGAGGSIGSRLSLLLARLGPARIVLLDSSEHNLFTINEILRHHAPDTPRTLALCDVRNEAALQRWFGRTRPTLVFHAAALKHVPLLEEQVEEAVLTNVLGTLNVARQAERHRADVAVLLSSDKAVNPASVMGATKRCAELLFQSFAAQAGPDQPRFISVRFGNVLGSTGSVVPLFERQIAEGGPVTVTHPEMTRYFMTIGEAVQLIVQAATHAASRPAAEGGVLVLDMGAPVRITDLAERMIRLHGRTPGADVSIDFVGLRPGERLHESLAFEQEDLTPSPIAKVLSTGAVEAPTPEVMASIGQLIAAAHDGRTAAVLERLRALAPGSSV